MGVFYHPKWANPKLLVPIEAGRLPVLSAHIFYRGLEHGFVFDIFKRIF